MDTARMLVLIAKAERRRIEAVADAEREIEDLYYDLEALGDVLDEMESLVREAHFAPVYAAGVSNPPSPATGMPSDSDEVSHG